MGMGEKRGILKILKGPRGQLIRGGFLSRHPRRAGQPKQTSEKEKGRETIFSPPEKTQTETKTTATKLQISIQLFIKDIGKSQKQALSSTPNALVNFRRN